MRRLLLGSVLAIACAGAAHADVLIVDRGLPTANLNNVSGADRSNVSWAIGGGYFIGDTFTVGGTAGTTYTIDTLQTWVVARDGAPLSATLYTGVGATADMTATSSTPTFKLVTYASPASRPCGGAGRGSSRASGGGANPLPNPSDFH